MRAFIFAVVLLFAANAHSQSKQQPAYSDQSKGQTAQVQNSPAKAMAAVTQNKSAPLEEGEHRKKAASDSTQESSEFWPSFHGVKLKVTDSLIALFTFLLVAVTVLLWRVGEQQIDLARDSSERQLRAYVGLSNAIIGPLVVGSKITVTLPMKNSGQTPAYAVRSCTNIIIQEISRTPDLVAPTHNEDSASGVMSPGLELHIPGTSDFIITQADFDAIDRKEKAVYVYGRIDYFDAFKRACFTEFRLRRSKNEIYAISEGGSLAICESGNRTEYSESEEQT